MKREVLPVFQATPGLTQSRTFCTSDTSLRVLQTACKAGKSKEIMKNNEIGLESMKLLEGVNSLLRLSQV